MMAPPPQLYGKIQLRDIRRQSCPQDSGAAMDRQRLSVERSFLRRCCPPAASRRLRLNSGPLTTIEPRYWPRRLSAALAYTSPEAATLRYQLTDSARSRGTP